MKTQIYEITKNLAQVTKLNIGQIDFFFPAAPNFINFLLQVSYDFTVYFTAIIDSDLTEKGL